MSVLKHILQISKGHLFGIYKNKKYSITKEIFNAEKSFKIYAEELEANDFISLNDYITTKNEF